MFEILTDSQKSSARLGAARTSQATLIRCWKISEVSEIGLHWRLFPLISISHANWTELFWNASKRKRSWTIQLDYLHEMLLTVNICIERVYRKKKTLPLDVEDGTLGVGMGSLFECLCTELLIRRWSEIFGDSKVSRKYCNKGVISWRRESPSLSALYSSFHCFSSATFAFYGVLWLSINANQLWQETGIYPHAHGSMKSVLMKVVFCLNYSHITLPRHQKLNKRTETSLNKICTCWLPSVSSSKEVTTNERRP